ncbi:hypothetical protein J1G35_30305, partial [Pseudomonas sp. SH10-3B]|nr:hypothetical protein [Pseudomonas sp. SH10-3B]
TTKVLDLSAFVGDAKARVGVWPFITTPYPVWLWLRGRTASNVVHDRTVFNGAGSSAVNVNWVNTGRIEVTIPRTYLAGLGQGTKLQMEFKAAVSRSKDPAQAIRFPLMEYTVNTLPAEFPVPKLTQANGSGTAVTLAPMNAQDGGTIEVRFLPMYTTDSIKATMVGTAGAGSPAIASKPGVTSGLVTFDIPKSAIAANIGNTDKTFTLKYEVTREGVVRSSVELTVTVTPIPASELAKTVIRINEANQSNLVLELADVVSGGRLRTGVWPFIAEGNRLWLVLSGKKADGSVSNHTHYVGTQSSVGDPWLVAGYHEKTVPASYLQALDHHSLLTLRFKATLSTSMLEANAIDFPPVTYTITSLPAEFPVPKLTQATGSGTAVTLAPMNAQDGGTIEVRFLPMYTTDSIKVTMVGTAGLGSPVIAAKSGVTSGVVTFDIPKTAIAANIGNANKTFTLKYEVTRRGVVRSSAVLTVTVTPIPVSELAKTDLQILEANATTKVLDLSAFVGDAKARVGVWPFITTPYPVWLWLRGRTASNVVHDRTVFDGAGVSAVNANWVNTGRIEVTIPRTYLAGLGHGTKLQMEFMAAVSRSKDPAQAIRFPLMEYTVNTLPAEFPVPKLTQASGSGTAVTLAPMNAQDGGTIEVRFLPMYTTDSIKVTMAGTAGLGSPVIAAKSGVTSGLVTFDIPKSAIAANIGNANKTFTLKYDVTREGRTIPSETLTVTVTPIPYYLLADVKVIEAENFHGALDLSMLTGNFTARVGVWPFITLDYPVWLWLRGRTASNAVHDLMLFNGAGGAKVNQNWITSGKIEVTIPRTYLTGLGHSTQFYIEFKAAMSLSQDPEQAVSFYIREYTIIHGPWRDSITDFRDGTTGGWRLDVAGVGGKVTNGYLEFSTPRDRGYGDVVKQVFSLRVNRTYQFSFDVMNISNDSENVNPIMTGLTLLPSGSYIYVPAEFTVPRDGKWHARTGTFTVPSNGLYRIAIYNGSLGSVNGGNNFRIDNIKVLGL